MFHQPPPGPIPNRKRAHQHRESKKWVRLPATQRCFECYPIPKPFLETAFGKIPPEIRAYIFKDVLTVGSISPLNDGISVPITRTKLDPSNRGSDPKPSIGPAKPASCLALLHTCHQIYHESSLLFYAINTMHLPDPSEMLTFLHHLGPVRCDELRSLHLANAFVPTGEGLMRQEIIHPDVKEAIQLINKRSSLRKIYLDMRPTQALNYIKLCTDIPGFRGCEMVFESPTRWFVMPPSTKWWFSAFVSEVVEKQQHNMPYYAYWRGEEKYRVEVNILDTLPEEKLARTDFQRRSVDWRTGDGSDVNTAMEDLSLL